MQQGWYKHLTLGSLQKTLITLWSGRKSPTFALRRYKLPRVPLGPVPLPASLAVAGNGESSSWPAFITGLPVARGGRGTLSWKPPEATGNGTLALLLGKSHGLSPKEEGIHSVQEKPRVVVVASVQLLSRVRLLETHRPQHARLPCPSLSPRVCSDSHPYMTTGKTIALII